MTLSCPYKREFQEFPLSVFLRILYKTPVVVVVGAGLLPKIFYYQLHSYKILINELNLVAFASSKSRSVVELKLSKMIQIPKIATFQFPYQ